MLNRIKNWNYKNINISQNNIVTLAMVLSIMALVMSIPSSSNCASADSCTVSSTGTFTGNMALKSGTNYTLTQQHAFSQDVIANWQDVGGTHTGTVIMKNSAGDFNINGGVQLGNSTTSTVGSIRWNGTDVQYVNSGGVWGNIDTTASPSNSFGVVDTTSGTVTAGSTGDTVTFVGSGGITTSATGSTVTITAGGGSTPMEFYGQISDATYTNSNDVFRLNEETFDTGNCFTLGSTPNWYLTYTCSDTRVFNLSLLVNGYGGGRFDLDLQGNGTEFLGFARFESYDKVGFTLYKSNRYVGLVCLEENDYLKVNIYNDNDTIEGTWGKSHYWLTENLTLTDTSPSCTNGKFN